MANLNIKELIKKAQSITENGLPFMEGRTQLALEGRLLEQVLTVEEYGYMKGEFGEYVVITFKEIPDNFTFGSSVVTQSFKALDEQLQEGEREMLLEEGLTVKFDKIKSKNKKVYIKVDFFPTVQE